MSGTKVRSGIAVTAAALAVCGVNARGQWTQPTAEELALTSIPEVPGAAAVYLYKEETTDDGLHMISQYVRLKVLTDRGKEYANVEIPYVNGTRGITVDSIAGRTIHPDGSVVMLTEKPYDKLVEKTSGYKVKERVFTLPAVEVGSVLEYRYKLRYDDHVLFSPDWIVQSDVYTRKAHYMWRPSSGKVITNDKEVSQGVAWTPILPAGAKVEEKFLHIGVTSASYAPTSELTLDVHDIPPIPNERYMPPVKSVSYRVLFYYSDVRSSKEYWEKHGREWTRDREKFIGPGRGVQTFVGTLVAPGDTQDVKARKLYAAVMGFENTDLSRARSANEDKANGLKEVMSTDDVLGRNRGNKDELTELYVAMCRAAGLRAYVMAVANRRERVFIESYLSMRQLDELIAVVSIDGKDVYFDPGQRYCEAEHLAWEHTLTEGLRETDSGSALATTPAESYKAARVSRVADLTLDEHGTATGTATVTYTGDPALHLRHEALREDEQGLKENLTRTLERQLPSGMEARVSSVENLQAYDKPLIVRYEVKGPAASAAGTRLALPADLFEASRRPRLPDAKRELAVDMEFPSVDQDAVRIKYADGLKVESEPTAEKAALGDVGLYDTHTKAGPNSITLYRNLVNGQAIYPVGRYAELRTFYNKVETADQEMLVLTRIAVR